MRLGYAGLCRKADEDDDKADEDDDMVIYTYAGELPEEERFLQ